MILSHGKFKWLILFYSQLSAREAQTGVVPELCRRVAVWTPRRRAAPCSGPTGRAASSPPPRTARRSPPPGRSAGWRSWTEGIAAKRVNSDFPWCSTQCGVRSLVRFCLVFFLKLRLWIGLHSSCCISPTANGTVQKSCTKYHDWPDATQCTEYRVSCM